MRRLSVNLAIALVLVSSAALCELDIRRGPSEQIEFEATQPRHEVVRIRIRNAADGAIKASADRGQSWRRIGTVTHPATSRNPRGYTASAWTNDSAVAATAVNGIHVKIANNPETGRGMIFSIIPRSEAIGAARGNLKSSIVTDMDGGTMLFGGYGPHVNSRVYLRARGDLKPLEANYEPSEGDEIVITRTAPARRPVYITFENRFGGRIWIEYLDRQRRLIGQVLRPVVGIGRFSGTVYAAPGRLRANHCGVIDISTSPVGGIGGFQIVPREHASSPEVQYISESTQWMVVGPPDVRDPSWEGIPPLFSGYLLPSYRPDDITGGHEDWMRRTLSRVMIQVRYDGGEWVNMPRVVLDPQTESNNAEKSDRGREGLWRIPCSLDPYTPLAPQASTALQGISHVRIALPMAPYWPQQD